MPHEAAGFLNREFGRDMLFVKGNAAKFQDLFSWQSLNRILAEHSLTPPRMYLSQRGRPAEDLGFSRTPDGSSVRRGTIPTLLDLGTLNSRMREGATLVINSIEQTSQPLTALCDGLADLFSTYPLVNAYVSSGAEDGFGLHWDDHEVFVLQIAGRKRWQIYHRSVEAPLIRTADAMRPPEKDEPVFDSLLEIGDLLYLPRGWWHAPRGIGEPSMHLTIELRVSFAGTQCTVDAEMYPALMRLLSHEKVTFSKLLSVAPNVAPGVLKSLLGDLLVLGLIHLVEEQ
jgi:hypothetical protein